MKDVILLAKVETLFVQARPRGSLPTQKGSRSAIASGNDMNAARQHQIVVLRAVSFVSLLLLLPFASRSASHLQRHGKGRTKQ